MDTVSNVNKLLWHNHDKIFLSHPPFQSEAVSFCHIPFPGYAVCFMLFQYNREKAYKIELLNTQLQNYNNQLCDFLADRSWGQLDSMQSYVTTHMMPNLRVTLIEPSGKVVYDNTNANRKSFANHSSRKEVQDALMYGSGYSISRQSESIQGEEYFYSARYYPPYRIIIRSALPYNLSLTEHLQADSGYLWFALIICLVLIFIFYRFTRKLGKVHHQTATVCHEGRPERTD